MQRQGVTPEMLYRAGYSVVEICKKLGMSHIRVFDILEQAGLTKRAFPLPAQEASDNAE